jgi:hypothetical protein
MKKLLVLLLLPLLTGCASLVGNSTEQVTVESTPSSAYFTITDSHGQIVATGTTPQTVTLKKSDGSYFGKIEYSLAVKAEGYHSTLVPLSMRFSHWYTFGNIIFFGVPGWLIVDPFSGGMYTFEQDRIQSWLRPCQPGPYNYTCS